MMLRIVPIFQKEAFAFITANHRHHRKPVGSVFQAAVSDGNKIVGVVVVGRPNGRKTQDGFTLEVTRLCTDGTPNACSILYATAAKIGKQLGHYKIITYTLMSENGASLKASGWILEAENAGGKEWNSSGNIIRTNETVDLFGNTGKKYPSELKRRWGKTLNKKSLFTDLKVTA